MAKVSVVVENKEEKAIATEEIFTFSVCPHAKGVDLPLVSYVRREKDSERVHARWADYGDRGNFINRKDIVISDQVKAEAKRRLIDIISFE